MTLLNTDAAAADAILIDCSAAQRSQAVDMPPSSSSIATDSIA